VTTSGIDVRPVGAEDWQALADFFGPSGAYSGCWCAWWRSTSAEFDAGCRSGGKGNRAVLHRLTHEGRVPGLLAYDVGGDPVGWVSVSPRPEFGRVLRSPTLKPRESNRGAPDDAGVWAVVCFWVPRARRGTGIGTALLAAAVDHARTSGARVLEGYPVDTAARLPPAAIFTGTLSMFLKAGFTQLPATSSGTRRATPSGTRRVVRLETP
jgi:GNAT superfamily N-acetyltransferase